MHQKLFIKQDFSDSEVEKAPLFSIDCVAVFFVCKQCGKSLHLYPAFPTLRHKFGRNIRADAS